MVQRTVTNGLVDYYKWLGGLTKKVWRVSMDGIKPYCKRQKGLARLVEWVSDIRNIPVRIFRLA